MFTGIIKGRGTVVAVNDQERLRTLEVALPPGADVGIEIGASISIDGVCLTVTKFNESRVVFDVMGESLDRTTIGSLVVGDQVNVERSAKEGVEIGGHPLSGHIDCVCVIDQVVATDNNVVMKFKVPQPFGRYIFSKGYIGLNGASLTVTNPSKKLGIFEVWFIPETLRVTTFADKKVGDQVNLEIERGTQVVVDTVHEFLEERLGKVLPKLAGLLEED